MSTVSDNSLIRCQQARHIDTRFYWIQDAAKRGVIKLYKVPTDEDPADLLTKPQSLLDITYKAGLVGIKMQDDESVIK